MRRPAAPARAALALVAAVAALATAGCGGGDDDADAPAAPAALKVLARVAVPERPGGVAVDGDTVWATVPERGELVRVRVGDDAPPARFRIARGLIAVVAAGGSVWAADPVGNAVLRVGPDGRVVARVPIHSPGELVAGFGSVWAVESVPTGIARIDLRTNRVVARVPVIAPFALTVGAGSLWAATRDAAITRIDPDTNRVAARIETEGWFPTQLAATDRAVWATNVRENAVVRIDPKRNLVLGQIVLPPERTPPASLAADERSVWVGGPVGVVRIDPGTNRIAGVVRVSRFRRPSPMDPSYRDLGPVLAAGGAAWVLDPSSRTLARIGRGS